MIFADEKRNVTVHGKEVSERKIPKIVRRNCADGKNEDRQKADTCAGRGPVLEREHKG